MDEAAIRYVRSGAFCVFHGWDETEQDHVLLVIERGNYKGTRREGYGVPGGHIDLESQTEQPIEAAIRELGEEIQTGDGQPVLTTITPDRLQIIDSGIDYKATSPGSVKVGVNWQGYRCELKAAELNSIKTHITTLQSDPAYAEAARDHADNEVWNVVLFPVQTFLQLQQEGRLDFTYAHELSGCLLVARSL